jgi:hypothetical protein
MESLVRDALTSVLAPVSVRLDLRGTLDRPTLRWALDRILPQSPGARQRSAIERNQSFPLNECDLHTAEEVESFLQTALGTYSLAEEPRIRGHLLSRSEHDHILLLTFQQGFATRRALRELVRELMERYAAPVRGQGDPFATLDPSYPAMWPAAR